MRQPLTLQTLGLSEEDLDTDLENTPDQESIPPQSEPEGTPIPEPQPEPEPQEPAETPEPEGEEVQPEPEPELEGKPYTPDEIRQELEETGTLDSSRLTDEQRKWYREFQRDYTKKTQQLATLRKQLEQQQLAPQPRQPQPSGDPMEQLYAQYRQSPRGVVRDINQNIAQLRGVQPHEQHYAQAMAQISQLQGLKDEFSLRLQEESAITRTARDAEQSALSRLQAQIPDLQAKAPKLEEFAIKAGLSKEDLKLLTNPALVGADTTVRVTMAINSWYEAAQAKETAKAKQTRPKPPELQHPAGTHETPSENDLETMPFGEFEKTFNKKMRRRRFPNHGKRVS